MSHQIKEEKKELENNKQSVVAQKVTNPILKKLMSFKTSVLPKLFCKFFISFFKISISSISA